MTSAFAGHDRVRVLLADHHEAIRSGIRDALNACSDITIAAEAADGREVLELAESSRTHVVLIDISLPGADALEVARRLAESTSIRVVMLSLHDDDASILGALQHGATGFVLKNAGAAEFEMAIRSAARGQSFLCPAIARQVIGAYLRYVDGLDGGRHLLTRRQRQILELIAEANTTKDIARRLGISVKTVEAHRSEIMRRLGVRNIAGLVQQAIRMGLPAS